MGVAVAAVAEVTVIPPDVGHLTVSSPEPGDDSPGLGCGPRVGTDALQELAVESDAVADLQGVFHGSEPNGGRVEANGLELAAQCEHGSPQSADCQGIVNPLVCHPVDGAALPTIQQGCPFDNGEQIHVNRARLVDDLGWCVCLAQQLRQPGNSLSDGLFLLLCQWHPIGANLIGEGLLDTTLRTVSQDAGLIWR